MPHHGCFDPFHLYHSLLVILFLESERVDEQMFKNNIVILFYHRYGYCVSVSFVQKVFFFSPISFFIRWRDELIKQYQNQKKDRRHAHSHAHCDTPRYSCLKYSPSQPLFLFFLFLQFVSNWFVSIASALFNHATFCTAKKKTNWEKRSRQDWKGLSMIGSDSFSASSSGSCLHSLHQGETDLNWKSEITFNHVLLRF